MALLHIGDAVSFGVPTGWRVTPDDRQEKVETMGGNVAQDFGHIESGDVVTVSATFKEPEFQKLKTIWNERQIVTATDESGANWQNIRIKLVSWSYVEMFPDTYNVEIEMWRC